MNNYTLGLKDATGNDLDIWDDFISLNYARKLNSAGRLTVTMPYRSGINPATILRDYHLVVYRSLPNGSQYLDMDTWWIIDYVDWNISEKTVTIEAGDLLHVLKRRIVGYTSQTPYADKTFIELGYFMASEPMMKEYVRENLGSDAINTVRDMDVLSVDRDQGIGPNVEMQAAWQAVLDTLNSIASQSAELGTKLYFDIIAENDDSFVFRVFRNFRGTDRSANSPSPTIMSTDSNLENIHLKWDYRNEKTHLYLSGEGGGAGVLYKEFGKVERDYSMWGRIEAYVDLGSDAGDDNYFSRRADEYLYSFRPKLGLEATLVDSPACRYGLDYRYGDLVSVAVEGYTFDCVIDTISISVDDSGEKISSTLIGEITL